MSMDPIADFLTIIRNGVMVAKPFVVINYSKMKNSISQILKNEGFIRDFQAYDKDGKKFLKLVLKYVDGESVIHEITRISTPGRRKYVGCKEIRPVVGNLGISIITTNQGVLSQKQAKKSTVGGELLCTVW
ncbi:MAG: 30S ribosomal protein S8 [Candidatus Dependentiae bacterium]|nr:30S ribosomal protein S8 [Candidatus Dependentiae bacterium]